MSAAEWSAIGAVCSAVATVGLLLVTHRQKQIADKQREVAEHQRAIAEEMRQIAEQQAAEQKRARQLTASRMLLDEISDERLRWLRPLILDGPTLPKDYVGEARRGSFDRIQALTVAFAHDRVAWLVSQQLLDEDEVYRFQGFEFMALWDRMEAVIREERVQNDGCCQHLEKMVKVFKKR